MRSDAIDSVVSTFLKNPVRASWKGSTADSLRGSFAGPRLEFQGLATAWLPLERVVVLADHASFSPGLPAHVAVKRPRVVVAVGQSAVDAWVKRFRLPFRLELGSKSLSAHTEIAGFPVGEIEAGLQVVGGWFVLQPRRASIMGVPNYVASLFRTYLPLPPLTEETRLLSIEHAPGELQLTFGLDDFEEEVTPGLSERLRARVLPWVR